MYSIWHHDMGVIKKKKKKREKESVSPMCGASCVCKQPYASIYMVECVSNMMYADDADEIV